MYGRSRRLRYRNSQLDLRRVFADIGVCRNGEGFREVGHQLPEIFLKVEDLRICCVIIPAMNIPSNSPRPPIFAYALG